MRDIHRVILHCSATPDYPEPSRKYDLFGAKDIDAWHKERGFDQIGYQYVVRRTGVLEAGRDVSMIGAHCKGHNSDSIGICYIGTRIPTMLQIETLLDLAHNISARFGVGSKDWVGHYELVDGKKICPGVRMDIMRKLIALRLGES